MSLTGEALQQRTHV